MIDGRDILLKGASLIEEGWCREALYKDKYGKSPLFPSESDQIVERCALAALTEAEWLLTGEHTHGHGQKAYLDAYDALTKEVGGSIPHWNNNVARDAHEVADTMRKVATQ